MGKLIGFYSVFRSRFLLLQKKVLSKEMFVLYEYLIAITDWDKKHSTYGSFKKTNKEIAKGLSWTESPVSRNKNSLIKKGFLKEIGNGRIKIPLYWMIEPTKAFKLKTGKYSDLQNEHADLQEAIAFMQGDFAFMQEKRVKQQIEEKPISDIKCLYKNAYSKDNKKIFIKKEARNGKLYEKIWGKGDYKYLIPEDMKWIDENIYEE